MIPQFELLSKSQISLEASEERSRKLNDLSVKIKELKRFCEYTEITVLLTECENFLLDPKNIYFADVYINKINQLIFSLSLPVKNKIKQLEFLMTLVEKYFDKININRINNIFDEHKNKLQNELDANIINKENINESLNELDQCLTIELKKIQEQILVYFQNKEISKAFEEYKSQVIGFLNNNDEKIKQKDVNEFFNHIEFLDSSIKDFEVSYQQFEARLAWIDYYEREFQAINPKLIDLDVINEKKVEIQDLINDLNLFSHKENCFDTLDKKISLLGEKLNELSQLNYKNFHEQHNQFIERLKKTKNTLTMHVDKKLSQSTTMLAKAKREKINAINLKINLLLETVINLEDSALNEKITDNISDLKMIITDAKNILFEYRGISLLRCFATLWGGGKVTSQLLVQTLEEQLIDLQSNINRLQA